MKLNLPPLDEDDDIDITPMLDCVFLLVLFFMVTSSFIDEPRMAPVPYTVTVPGDDEKIFTLSVEGTYLLRDGDREEDIGSLAELAERISKEPGKKFRIETRAAVRSISDDKKEDVQVVPLALPRADQPKTIRRDDADQLTVPREGSLRFKDVTGERTYRDTRELLEALEKRQGEARKRPVILRADAKCNYQQVVQARNALRLAGVELIFEEVEVRNGNR